MPYRDMRDYLETLEQHDLLRRVTKQVDRDWEVACLAKWMYQALPVERRFGLFFQNVNGSNMPVATAALGASPRAVALALRCEVEEINDTVVSALRRRIAPRIVGSAMCQENVHLGGEASLDMLPVVTWTPGKDRAPYITTIVITRNHDTSVQNMGVYRSMLRDPHSVVVNLGPGRQGTRNVKTWVDRGKAAPVAWVIASEPAVHLATVANLPYGKDEIDLAGGLKGEPIDLVPAKSIDLLVPANSEIVIEGKVSPRETDDEGPFGEFAGVMGQVEKRPVARITAITHRTGPIYYGYTSQMPPSESTTIQSLMNAGVILHTSHASPAKYQQPFGRPAFRARGLRLQAQRPPVVDADVDIRDPAHVDWALNARFDPRRDTIIIDDVNVPLQMDPSVRDALGKGTMGSKIVLDATQKFDPGPFSLPPRHLMEKALGAWRVCGLPDFKVPKRAQLRIDKS
jgi:UbiD family decarboxylase